MNVLKKDHDGNWYSLPSTMVESFVQHVESIENSEFMSANWFSAVDELDSTFGEYMKEVV